MHESNISALGKLGGYSGKYTDYSSRNYPILDYPVVDKKGAETNGGGNTI